MKLTCAIIDDEPLAVELLESYVRKTPFLELKGAYNGGITALLKPKKSTHLLISYH